VIVRSAGATDVEALARLRAAWREEDATSGFVATFREWMEREQSSRMWWLAEHDGDATGMVNVKTFERMPSPGAAASRWGYLANLYVLAAYRGSGAGSELIQAAVEHARARNFVRLVLAPSEPALPLYARHGFRSAHELLVLPLDARL
jgi:GNAT superfamily N-acetyltransferase